MAFTLACVIIVGGVAVLIGFRHPSKVYVATADLPAFHRITERDVRLQEMPEGDLPQGSMKNLDSLVGRYTLTRLAKDKPFDEPSLGPLLAPGSLDGLLFAPVEATPESTLGNRLTRGDRVNVLLSSTTDKPTSAELTDVLVVDVTKEVVVIGITPAQSKTLLRALGTNRISIVRLRAYARP
ncbi:SAF domain-containing protein [Planotetraspora thailandica]|uniref:SAF domain-containing protein n=1 Tax=Planotetraspora thailandica TaxID=487172 RepID=UPI00194DE811|nr:SAF domain-containing protein [Planotetraspora thailandica]